MSKGPLKVAAGILWREGRYLAVQRPEGFRMAGKWEFPGGKIEPGEEPGHTLVRELEEELGVIVREYSFWRELTHAYDVFEVRLRFYHVTDFAGEPRALEGQRMQWCDPARPEDWEGLDFLDADKPIVLALKDYEISVR